MLNASATGRLCGCDQVMNGVCLSCMFVRMFVNIVTLFKARLAQISAMFDMLLGDGTGLLHDAAAVRSAAAW